MQSDGRLSWNSCKTDTNGENTFTQSKPTTTTNYNDISTDVNANANSSADHKCMCNDVTK